MWAIETVHYDQPVCSGYRLTDNKRFNVIPLAEESFDDDLERLRERKKSPCLKTCVPFRSFCYLGPRFSSLRLGPLSGKRESTYIRCQYHLVFHHCTLTRFYLPSSFSAPQRRRGQACIVLDVDETAKGYSELYGARAIARIVRTDVLFPLAQNCCGVRLGIFLFRAIMWSRMIRS